MDLFVWAILIAVAFQLLKAADQSRRILLLGRHLARFNIEKAMEQLVHGYQRALGENDEQRRGAIWCNLQPLERALSDQFSQLVAGFARVDEPQARVSRLPMALPWATRVFPQACFDMRKVLAIHAHGFERVSARVTESPLGDGTGAETRFDLDAARDRAFTFLAEMLLMQHSCHWFCKSKNVASARMLLRHQTTHEQVVAAVTPQTRQAYAALVGMVL